MHLKLQLTSASERMPEADGEPQPFLHCATPYNLIIKSG